MQCDGNNLSVHQWTNGYRRCDTYILWHISQPPKKEEIPPFVTTQKDLEGVMLSEISLTKTNTVRSHLHVEPENTELNKAREWNALVRG